MNAGEGVSAGAVSNAPLISIVVPTRERPDTLRQCLANLMQSRSPRIEIVVQDNCSSPDTAQIVAAARGKDARVVSRRSERPLSQRENFESGIAACRGRYLGIIGDDDGFCSGALDWLVEALEQNDVDAVRWNRVDYVWPDLSSDGVGFINLEAGHCGGGAAIRSTAAMASAILDAANVGSWDNILIYHGLVARRICERMQAATGGQLFAYPMPDVYAHTLLPFVCQRLLQVDEVLSIYGLSRHSAGASWSRPGDADEQRVREGRRWIEESRADPVAESVDWQPEIRAQRYHEFVVLGIGARAGLIGDRVPNEARFAEALLSEISGSRQLADSFHRAQPEGAAQRRLVEKVRERFPSVGAGLPASMRHVTHDARRSLRVHDVDPNLTDDLLGATEAIASLTGPSDFGPVAIAAEQPAARPSPVGTTLKWLVQRFPGTISRLSSSPLMPHWLWRSARRTVIGDRRNDALERRILELRGRSQNRMDRTPKSGRVEE